MDTYEDITSRLSSTLEEICSKSKEPLKAAANLYRTAAEGICKCVISALDQAPTSPGHKSLDQLASTAATLLSKTEPKREVDVVRAGIRYLQNIGNLYSHDSQSTKSTDAIGQESALPVLIYVLRIVFSGALADCSQPNYPEKIESEFPPRLRNKPIFENPRASEVVLLCFPKSDVQTRISKAEQATNIAYDYIVVDLGGNLTKGFLFLKTRSAIEKSLLDFSQTIGNSLPNSLDIITPRVTRTDGKEIDRLKSVLEAQARIFAPQLTKITSVSYFDDLVWNQCLPSHFRNTESNPMITDHFIDQHLQDTALSEFIQRDSLPPYSTSSYLKDVLDDLQNVHPTQVIVGPAGIGKTTFCNTLISQVNKHPKKRAILISATDFRELPSSQEIRSVRDLYALAIKVGALGEEESIEAHNFEINLGCGNVILVIDGFDELESHLADTLDVDAFMNSLTDLNQSFRKVLVIITVRDYLLERFKKFDHVAVSKLVGFSDTDVNTYLNKRLQKEQIAEANQLLLSFRDNSEDSRVTIPLYASLICDYLQSKSETPVVTKSLEVSKFFISDKPIDTLLVKIIEREITKQALKGVSVDDFYELLLETLKAPQSTIGVERLREFFLDLQINDKSVEKKFARGPFLLSQSNGTAFKFKYDSLSPLLKARYLFRWIGAGNFVSNPMVDFVAECHRGEGALMDELRVLAGSSLQLDVNRVTQWFQALLKYRISVETGRSRSLERRAISGFLYWAIAFRQSSNKQERSSALIGLFKGNNWDGMSIFGKFVPLDLRDVTISNAYLENFTNLEKCVFPEEGAVFFNSEINFDRNALPNKLRRDNFDHSCSFSENIFEAFSTQADGAMQQFEVVRDNLYKILKVGFRSSNFFWKSRLLYRSASLVGRASQDRYLSFLVTKGLLIQEPNREKRSESGYSVAPDWRQDARHLIEDKNVTVRMKKVIDAALEELN